MSRSTNARSVWTSLQACLPRKTDYETGCLCSYVVEVYWQSVAVWDEQCFVNFYTSVSLASLRLFLLKCLRQNLHVLMMLYSSRKSLDFMFSAQVRPPNVNTLLLNCEEIAAFAWLSSHIWSLIWENRLKNTQITHHKSRVILLYFSDGWIASS